ncbi:HAD family hydrolase [Deinococcus maricopensis]|uniref:HAD-superfamily hydrolase, subfamily IA, variant 1 n=1 Tax=Deinococcus maricopensis (strain DSM 21211 / LMG 22137 / NRRL B-23946 / LB-34) TaxID=709986 RepID=E8U8H9_DEIML|nr:HAD family hydrolase [Deinococcus maricopensis]ADV67368.1 HAD-superfamily hydrolase, subfamily IA, variant 1 [Deinococcus maricopensis DSM 21211]
MSIRAVIMDLDGTLVDSNDAHARAWVAALRDFGIERTFEDVRPLIGMGGDQLLPRVADVDPNSERGEGLTQAWAEHFKPMIPELRATRGARELLEALHGRGLRVILGTSGDSDVIDPLLEHIGVRDLVPDRVTADDVEASKPEPDILHAALQKLGVGAHEALMVGDTPFDAEAAKRANVRVALLRAGGDERVNAEAFTFDDPADLAAHLDDVLR